jgi:serine/threonine protein kinase
MMDPPSPSERVMGHDRQKTASDLLSRVRSMWQHNQAPDALAFLGEHASVRGNRALTLDLAYEEFFKRREQGEQVDIASFCNRFPSIRRSLHKQLEVHEGVMRHPSLVGRQVMVSWPRRGDDLFGFRVVEEIGRGAFARAYLCAQPGIGNRQVVVKVSPGGALEADTMGGLDHPNIMSVYSVQVDVESKLSGICMPFVGRSTLYDVIDVAHAQGRPPRRSAVILEASRALARRGDRYHQLTPRMPLRPTNTFLRGVLRLVVQIADALAHAHERGVLHGDLKPSNIVMSVSGIPLLVDFNLSHSRESNNLVTGGTLPYMAPEQIRIALLGAAEGDRVDQRSDLYSLGVMIFELLTGRLPFQSSPPESEPAAAAGRMLDAQQAGVPPLRDWAGSLEPGLSDLLARCLAFDPAQRPDDANQVVYELQHHLGWSKGFRRGFRRTLHQHPSVATGLATTLSAGLLASALWWAQRPPLPQRHYQRGLVAYQQHDFASAVESLNHAIAADQQFAQAYLARGCAAIQCYERDKFEGWLESAYRDFTLAARHGSGHEAQEARAYCLICNNDFETAASVLKELQRHGRVSVADANNLAYCYEKLSVSPQGGKQETEFLLTNATKNLRLAVTLGPTLIQPHINFAIVALAEYRFSDTKKLPSEGLEAARRAISLGSNHTSTYFFAARLAGVMAHELNDAALFDECLGYLEAAVDRGHDLKRDPQLSEAPFDKLLDHPRVQSLLSRKIGRNRPTYASRLIIPGVISSPSFLIAESGSLGGRDESELP